MTTERIKELNLCMDEQDVYPALWGKRAKKDFETIKEIIEE